MAARRASILGLFVAALVSTACPSPIEVAHDDARVRLDLGIVDGGAEDSGIPGDAAEDAAAPDDDGSVDAAIDAGAPDSGAPDAGGFDAAVDAGALDAAAPDASPPDAGQLDPRLSPADGAGQSCQYVSGSGECGLAEVCRFYSPLEGRCESCTNCGNLHDPCARSSDCDIVFVCFEGVCTNFCVLGAQSCGKQPCIDVGYPNTGVCAP
ncbi:hypothetical protein L6R52_23860 [Myxococcota bacterium]|nr:hypothetical protein [Myxococcota bacterium]